MKTITNKNGLTAKMGRNKSVDFAPKLRMRDYITTAMPAPPDVCDYQHRARKELKNMYLNGNLSDCVIAMQAHLVGVFTANQEVESNYAFTDEQIETLYGVCGYIPGDPSTDQGCNIISVLNAWENKGAPAGSNKISGVVSVNAANPVEYRTAIWLFENIVLGLDLPDAWVNPFPSESGFIWDAAGAPDPQNGHCVPGIGYDTTGVNIATWGMVGLMTDAAIQDYLRPFVGGEMYTVLSPEIIASAQGKAHNGFDFEQLQADFNALGRSFPS